MITASQLYNFVQCPTRAELDFRGDRTQKEEPSDFVQMLWDQGLTQEQATALNLPISVNIDDFELDARGTATLAAMAAKSPLIFHGVISADGMTGTPDLLKLKGDAYVPGDIKSGSGTEGSDDFDPKPKKHYSVQVAHYVNILEALGLSDGTRTTFVIDRFGATVDYDLNVPQGARTPETWWEFYERTLASVQRMVDGETHRPALSSTCKLCQWSTPCKELLIAENDLSLIAELGRAKRDVLMPVFPEIKAFLLAEVGSYGHPKDKKKTVFPGIGPDTLRKLRFRAKVLSEPENGPVLKELLQLPIAANEVFFDIEADPIRDLVYLHGFAQRKHGEPLSACEFAPYLAEQPNAEHEEQAFAEAWAYLNARVVDSIVYYYSPYERTAYKNLAKKYGAVCTAAQVEELFALPSMIDLYNIVKRHTEWPAYDQSIKSLAKFQGFSWRDTNPSGAASIEWYHRWVVSQDGAIRTRILEYNEDDCLATAVVLDGIRVLCERSAVTS
jgi:predicted RecB family nuclease